MCKTIGKWLVSQLGNFHFIKAKVDKHFSPSTLPIFVPWPIQILKETKKNI